MSVNKAEGQIRDKGEEDEEEEDEGGELSKKEVQVEEVCYVICSKALEYSNK